MSYFDDLKKQRQNLVQNVYNAATGNTQKPATPQAQAPNTKPSPAAQTAQNQQNQQAMHDQAMHDQAMHDQAMHEQAMTDWAAEYDKVMSGGQTPTNVGSGTARATQPPVSNAAQSALGEGAGQWQAELDNVMAQIMGKGKFDYNMNGDAMYQQYADIYQNQANLGMQNAMAQAAALTGGYGSSYGQMVGQQAYAQQMQGLNDIGLELYDRAYAQDMAERSQLIDQYNMLAAREEQAYNRGIDERNFEYQQGRDEVADEQWQQSFDYNKYLDELEQANFDKQFEYRQGRDTVADEQWNKQFASQEEQRAEDNAYRDKTFEYQQGRDEVYDSQWKAELDRMLANDEISQQQWQAEMDRALANDATANEQWKAGMDWQAEEFDKLYGEGGYYTTEAQKDREHQASQNQLNREHNVTMQNDQQSHQKEILKDEQAYNTSERLASQGYNDTVREDNQAHDKEMQNDSQTYQSEMATKQHDWQVEEWDKMYGEDGYMTNKDKQDQANWQAEFDREGEWYDDAQEASKTTTKYEGEGALNGQSVPKQLAGVQNLTTTNTNLFDETGSLKSVAIVKTTPTGDGTDSSKDVVTYNIGGEEVELRRGYSPYTNNKNPDANNGTFNGYQPNNVASYYDGDKEAGKLSNAGFGTIINGQTVPVYTDGKGVEWVYDAANNKYEKYEYEEKKEPTTLGTGKGTGRPSGVYAPTQVLK